MSPAFRPLSPDAVTALLVERIADRRGLMRVAIDGPPCAEPHTMAEALTEPLRALGRPAHLVRAEAFWRDASLRLEYGREDPDSYPTWLDAAALRREVLDRAVAEHAYLPSLRDPRTNRATRAEPRALSAAAVVIVSGALLLGLGLPFELTVHLVMSPAARARRTPAEQAWTLPAFDRYELEVQPVEQADIIIGLNDPKRPAVASH